MLTRRHKIIVGVGGVVLMPVALAAGIYIGAVWENYKRMRSPPGNTVLAAPELRKEEKRLLDERALLERRISALEANSKAVPAGGRSPSAGPGGAP